MAWIRYRDTKKKGRTAHIQWRDRKGRLRSKEAGTTDPRLLALLKDQVEAKEEGRAADRQIVTSATEARRRFLTSLRSDRLKPATIAFYERQMKDLWDAWAGIPMEKWDRLMLEEFIASKTTWGPRMIQMTVRACRRFIRWAEGTSVVVPDFTKGYRGPKVVPPKPVALTPPEAVALLQAAKGHPYLDLCVGLAMLAGLSLADLRAITWEEIDLQGGWIRRTRSKTGEPIAVPICDELREILVRPCHRATHGRVIRRMPTSESAARRGLVRLTRRAGLEPFGKWHRLRKTFATLMLNAGVSGATIGDLLSHAEGSSERVKYLAADDAGKRKAVAALGAVLGDASRETA